MLLLVAFVVLATNDDDLEDDVVENADARRTTDRTIPIKTGATFISTTMMLTEGELQNVSHSKDRYECNVRRM